MINVSIYTLFAGVASIACSLVAAYVTLKKPDGNKLMQEIAGVIRVGASRTSTGRRRR